MDLPIQLRFFKKLELYQELQKRNRDNQGEWRVEKHILSWAADRTHHKDLQTPLAPDMAGEHEEITGPISNDDVDNKQQYIHNRLGNLVAMGYADWDKIVTNGIVFNSDGFLTGEIINEIRNSPMSASRYEAAYYLSWILFYAGAFLVIANVLNVLGSWVVDLMHIASPVCHHHFWHRF